MTEQRREQERDDTQLHAESDRLRQAMLDLVDELLAVVGDLQKLLADTQGSDGDDGRTEGQAR
jgi:hypothetical protein